MSENKWSPFDPEWYKQAFDKFISTADELFNQDEIIKQGYDIPDSDGSKSSVFRNNAVLNNSFNEKALRETLKDIYLNSTNTLIASNHDTVGFYQYQTSMKNINLIENTKMCQFVIPTDKFFPDNRDKYKLTQLSRKWISIDEVLNNRDIFNWAYLIFINQRIYTNYEIRIDDHEVTIRFPYNQSWVDNNYSIYVYKFPTNLSCRMKVTKWEMREKWNWSIPIEDIHASNISNFKHVIAIFNDNSLGDNIEFINIENGKLDFNNISQFNKNIVASGDFSLSIIVPKYFNEYPILLPTDIISRPYIFDMNKVVINDDGEIKSIKTANNTSFNQVYSNIDGHINEQQDGWKYIIRPIVLSDAYKVDNKDPYEDICKELSNLKDTIITASELVETFRFDTDESTFDNMVNRVDEYLTNIHTIHNNYLLSKKMEYNEEYDIAFSKYQSAIKEVKENRTTKIEFNYNGHKYSIWDLISPCIYMPRDIIDKYDIAIMVSHISRHGNLWNDPKEYQNQIRFTRPIDINDFWTFEYDMTNEVWRPYMLNVEHHFPDVYTFTDSNEDTPSPNRVFKAFIFYSDNINTRNKSVPIKNTSSTWDNDMEAFMYNKGGIYRDIFMEKFYWMGLNTIYQGIIQTKYRWELIEYVIDNDSYNRFNELFLKSMDPYFKLGLATYLKSDNYEFPFDDAISKMNESINEQFIGYQKVTNYEMYLNKTWIPSYFDYITSIMDDYQGTLVRRPRTTFDTIRLIPTLVNIQTKLKLYSDDFINNLNNIIDSLKICAYGIDINEIKSLIDFCDRLLSNIDDVYNNTYNLDMDIYSIQDMLHIKDLMMDHISNTESIGNICNKLHNFTSENSQYQQKIEMYKDIKIMVDRFIHNIDELISYDSLNLGRAIKTVIDTDTLDQGTSNDYTIIGYINQFTSPWNDEVIKYRNELFNIILELHRFNEKESYNIIDNSIQNALDVIYATIEKLKSLLDNIKAYNDQVIIDKINYVIEILNKSSNDLTIAIITIDVIQNAYDCILKSISKCKEDFIISNNEEKCYDEIINNMNTIIDDAGKSFNKDTKIDIEADNLIKCVNQLNEYVEYERKLFESIIELTDKDGYVSDISQFNDNIIQIASYIDTIDYEYTPDTQMPNYVNIYQVTSISIDSDGFDHQVGDIVYIPNIGVYKITSIEDGVILATVETRNTSFRNARWQTHPYDTITDGNGMGLTITPLEVNTTILISDKPTDGYINRISTCINELYNNLNKYNSIANVEAEITLSNIETIKCEWEELMEKYEFHMSPDLSNQVSDLMLSAYEGIDIIRDFNDIRKNINPIPFITVLETFMAQCYKKYDDEYGITPNYRQYDNRVRNAYNALLSFIGNGSSWSNVNELITMLNETLKEIDLFAKMILIDTSFYSEMNELINIMHNHVDTIIISKKSLDDKHESINEYLDNLVIFLHDITPDRVIDKWYYITSVTVASGGQSYQVGDIVEVIPQLPVNYKGEEDHTNEEIIMNDRIFIQIKQVDENGSVIKADSLISYNALPYALNGARQTKSCVGNGEGFVVYIGTTENLLENSPIFSDEKIATPDKYDENDLMKFDFSNPHNLNIGYEVFLAGKQINDFIVRHTSNDLDSIYINANDIINLQKSSIVTEGEHYYTYKLDRLSILNPGAGYKVGQTIWVKTDTIPLKLIVTELDGSPYNRIKSVEFAENKSTYTGNPSSSHAEVIDDSISNIDDEYSGAYYDTLTQEGIIKPATLSFDQNEFVFTSIRFDDLENGDRNQFFMYRPVDKPDNAPLGDQDYHWYQGVEYDDIHKWLRVDPLVPTKDPMLGDNIQLPPNQPRNAEFQFIKRLRIHDSSEDSIPTLKPISADDIEMIVEDVSSADPSEDFTFDAYIISPIQNNDIEGMYDGIVEGKSNDPIPCDDGIIVGIDKSLIRDLMLGNILPEITESYVDGEVLATDITDMYAITFINNAMKGGIIEVDTYADLPAHISEWRSAKIGDGVIVNDDETMNHHRTLYRLRTFSGTGGYFVYERPELADYKWNIFDIKWADINFFPDYPSDSAMYPSAGWDEIKKFSYIENKIDDGKVTQIISPKKYYQTFISDITIDDLSVYNHTLNRWEDLSSDEWILNVTDTGFELIYTKDGAYSYDMSLYLNKKSDNQIRNASLKQKAIFDISAVVDGEVNIPSVSSSVNVGRHLRIRKLYPFEQKEIFTIGGNNGYNMDFKIMNYNYYRNELHLEDIQIYNKSAGRFEDVLDSKKFEVQFKDPKAVARGKETQTNIIQTIISNAGSGFTDGDVWGYNREYNTHVFGQIKTDHDNGAILTFTPIHVVNAPIKDLMIDFNIYQYDSQMNSPTATAIIEFQTSNTNVWGDGYIHKVQNRLAPLPKEFRIVCLYDLDEPAEYEVTISTTPKKWEFVFDKDMVFPTFHIDGYILPQDHLYILGSKGRYPIVNPSTGKPSIVVTHTDTGTDVKFLNLYYAYDHIEIHYLPYPIRSIYTKRKLPSSGYVDLSGKINKPLNKKYFEFWMNGRLLHDEVSIITPTKIFIHGAKSIRNFEIIEINRDPNEFFADNFLSVKSNEDGALYPVWNLTTYLDDALSGTLNSENYTLAEQKMLITPVWPQVDSNHEEFKNYPPNMDGESDILLKVDEDFVAVSEAASSYQYTVIDVPTIEGIPVNERSLTFGKFGFKPITEDMIINLLNEEWKEELANGLLPSHTVISTDEWYGLLARLYDENGVQVHSLSEAAYKVLDPNLIRINDRNKLVRIVHNDVKYDLN